MLVLALLFQVQAGDPTYATPALREFVARAAMANRAPPLELRGYRARAETELAFILRDSLGRELVGQIEQIAAHADWARDGRYELHVVGYRAQSLGNPYSALTFTRMYTTPTLYGNRLALGMNDGVPRSRADSSARRKRLREDSIAGRPPTRAFHPLAADRDRYYRFAGGDTVAVIMAAGRAIRVVRVIAEPVTDRSLNFVAFQGELDFDAARFQLVRMRGRFVDVTARKDPLLIRGTGAVAMAYIEFENAEFAGRYWLPAVQRSEFQAQMQMLGDVRPIYRIITRFRDFMLDTSAAAAAEGATIDVTSTAPPGAPAAVATRGDTLVPADSAIDTVPPLPPTRARLTFASRDSISGYARWEDNIGTRISAVGGGDFDDLAPDVWKPTGRPSFSYWPRRLEDVVRYNRVEGMFTGVSGSIRFRDLAPGWTARGYIGVAWEPRSVRGALSVTRARGHWIHSARVERALAVTDDFLDPFETGLSIGPLISSLDDSDYLDRWTAALATTRVVRNVDRALLTLELAAVRDRPEIARLANGLFSTGASFRANRKAAAGDYGRAALTLEYHPRVTGEGLTPGLGARVRVEAARGELEWQRVDARLTARSYWSGLVFASRLDAGAVFGTTLPPQVMFELGGGDNLPSYRYKEFGGDRAVLGRGLVAYHFPVLRAPRRVRRLIIPGLSPGIGVGAAGGWSEASSPAARAALLALGGDGITPLSAPTGRIRASADFRVTILSGAIGAGVARPLDQAGRRRPFFVWGAGF